MIRTMRTAAALAAVLACCVNGAWAAPAGVPASVTTALDQSAADTAVVILVPSMSGLSKKIAAANEGAGLNIPDMADALTTFKNKTGLSAGVREDGAFAVLLSNLPLGQAGAPHEPTVHMLVPVTDYKVFVDAGGGDAAKPVTQVKMGQGQPAFARKLGNFALLSDTEANVTNYQAAAAGKAMAAATGKLGGHYLAGNDIVVIVNLPLIADQLRSEIKKDLAHANAANAGGVEKIAGLYGEAIDAFLRDTTSLTMGLELKDTGIGFSYTAQFKPDSACAKAFATGASAAGKLDLLPSQPYMLAMAVNPQGIDIAGMVEKLVAAIPENEAGAIRKLVAGYLPLVQQTKSVASAYYVPSPGAQGMSGFLNAVSVVQADDAPGYAQKCKEYITSLNGLKLSVPKPAAPGENAPPAGDNDVSFSTQINANALQIDGVAVDQYQFQTNLPPAIMQEMGPAAPMMMALGATGQSGYIAPVNGHVLMTNTLDAQMVRKTIASVRGGKGLGTDKGMAATRGELPPNASAEMYINVSTIMNTAMGIAAQMAGPGAPPAQQQAELPPIAAGLGVDGSGVAARMFLPMPVIKLAVEKAGPMIGMMLMGGMGLPQPAEPMPQEEGEQKQPAF
ncbi:MAG: DUF3352 domain-containing protein [Planctomycetes bacterium]|nr:DUF3352 domain-containing protein [Planctomycetota bacterium]